MTDTKYIARGKRGHETVYLASDATNLWTANRDNAHQFPTEREASRNARQVAHGSGPHTTGFGVIFEAIEPTA